MEIENTTLSEVTETQKEENGYVLTHKWILATMKGLCAYYS